MAFMPLCVLRMFFSAPWGLGTPGHLWSAHAYPYGSSVHTPVVKHSNCSKVWSHCHLTSWPKATPPGMCCGRRASPFWADLTKKPSTTLSSGSLNSCVDEECSQL